MSDVDIFSVAKPQGGEFFAFKQVGDQIQGTYIDQRRGVDSYGNDQIIYVLQDKNGKVWNLGFRLAATITHERMRGISFGQIIGFKFEENRPSKQAGRNPTKIIRIYDDKQLVDQAWLDQQKAIEARYEGQVASASARQIEPAHDDGFGPFGDNFKAPESAVPVSSGVPEASPAGVAPRNEAVDAIRNLARTKGLTTESMSEADADKAIEQYTGLTLTEENLTKIIIKLTSYSK